MLNNRKVLIIFILMFVDISLISIGHYLNMNSIILLSLLLLITILLISPYSLFLAILLFYLPWSPVMKFNAEDHSFYTICFVLYFIYFLIVNELEGKISILRIESLILTCSIFMYTMIIKLFFGNSFSLGYLVFIFMVILIPTYIKVYHRKISFEICIVFFSLGIVFAGLSSKILMNYSHMLPFIKVSNWETIGLTRLSGFYGDANFYSAHILVAVSGLLIIMLNKSFKNVVLLSILVLTLLYFGLLSVSKMFLVVLLSIIVIWSLVALISKGKITTKISIFIVINLGCLIIATSELFAKQINMYSIRFKMVSDISTLTTGRSDILSDYFTFFKQNPTRLLFGQGYSEVFNGGITDAAHNTIIQIIYQFGIIGSIILLFWIIHLFNILDKTQIDSVNKRIKINLNIFIFAIACFAPWLTLDILFADELFFITSLFLIGINYIKGAENV